jgi:hypothetical protein
MQSITHGAELFQFARTGPIHLYNFASGKEDSRFKCGETDQDAYRIFLAGIDGAPMLSFADVIQPSDA